MPHKQPPPTLYRPAEGRRALKPDGTPLSAQGEPIAMTPYWRRLRVARDIEAVPASSTKSTTSKSSTTKSGARAKSRSDEGSTSA
ncbi:MAG: hypothetical protein AB7E24_00250 [Novosphingobium sp.]